MGDETEKRGGRVKRRRYVLIVDLGNDEMFIKDVAVARRLPRPAASSQPADLVCLSPTRSAAACKSRRC